MLVQTSNRTNLVTVSLCVGALTLVATALGWESIKAFSGNLCSSNLANGICSHPIGWGLIKTTFFTLAVLPFVFLTERLRPAVDSQPLVSNGFLTDGAWLLLTPVVGFFFIHPLSTIFSQVSALYASYFSIDVSLWQQLPLWAKILFAILLSDLISWAHHWARHKSPLLWEFHKLHHSQHELNFLTTYRIHPLDTTMASLLRYLPFFILPIEIGTVTLAGWWMVKKTHGGISHLNLKSNFGFLRYIIVSPQSHRVHHASADAMKDKNFGEVFVFWDIMFGTQHWDFNVYPTTGVDDEAYPHGADTPAEALVSAPMKQLFYPITRPISLWVAKLSKLAT